MAKRQSITTVCPTCGATCTEAVTRTSGPGYVAKLYACPRCTAVLIKAFAGVAQAWSEAHGSAKERFFERLIDRLKKNGFDSVEPFRPHTRRV